ncbi:ATP-binding protein [Marinobacterium rhizophilum]|uniref:sensor histidine kinase n=1 Tax=Marinobacterium rhizophilum TaxID=420402 RepID=UPI000382552B|nr:ATP-binding protein [Marinobacterium rhizophilum]
MTNQLIQTSRTDRSMKWLLPSLIVVVGLAVSLGFVNYEQRAAAEIQRDLAAESLSRLSADLEQALHARLSITTALGAFVQIQGAEMLETPQQKRQFKENFEQFTRFLDNRIPGIMSMQLAPQGVVTYVTNEESNSKAIGHDLLVDDARREQVIETVKKRTLIVAGPIKLIQGGEAIIARLALFTRAGAFSPERYRRLGQALPNNFDAQQIPNDFWGLATVLVDIPALYQSAGLQKIAERYPLAIRGKHGLGEEGEVFLGSPDIFEHPSLQVPVIFPGGSWVIAVKLDSPPLNSTSVLLLFCGFLGSAALAYGVSSRDSRNRAQAHSRAKSAFLSTMSHELRTPMNAIMGFAQILDYDGKLDAEQRESVREILTASEHLLTLINEVLDLAKIESGGLELSVEAVDVAELFEESRKLIAPMARQQSVSVHASAPGELFVQADRLRLKQVVLNLLSNAVKYNHEGGAVSLTAVRTGNRVRIQVEDNGRGIGEEDQARLFEPFSRVGESAGAVKGTGIGLTITKSLVLLMNGDLGLESAPGVGSRFWVDLPPASWLTASFDDTRQQGTESTPESVTDTGNSERKEANNER